MVSDQTTSKEEETDSVKNDMNTQEKNYRGWHSLFITNGTIELVAPLDIGIRLLHLGLTVDQTNCLFEREMEAGKKNSPEWLLYGGHRLWFAPEHEVQSYIPDNSPIAYSRIADTVRLSEPVAESGLQKEMDLVFESENKLRVLHRVRNHSTHDHKISLWPITAFAGGTATLPLPVNQRPLNPAGAIVLWPYTKMDDPRISYDHDSHNVRIEQRGETRPLKIGLAHAEPGVLCLDWKRGSLRFRKSFERQAGRYPDFGSCIECYTNHELIELETLSPETKCPPGAAVEHTEIWEIWRED